MRFIAFINAAIMAFMVAASAVIPGIGELLATAAEDQDFYSKQLLALFYFEELSIKSLY